jgi:hypothetical protein
MVVAKLVRGRVGRLPVLVRIVAAPLIDCLGVLVAFAAAVRLGKAAGFDGALQAAFAAVAVAAAVQLINRRLPKRTQLQLEATRERHVASGGDRNYSPPEHNPSLLDANQDPVRGRQRLWRDLIDLQLGRPAQLSRAAVPPLAYLLITGEFGQVILRAAGLGSSRATPSAGAIALLLIAGALPLTVAADLHYRRVRSPRSPWCSVGWVDTPAWIDAKPQWREAFGRARALRSLPVPTVPVLLPWLVVIGAWEGCWLSVTSRPALLMPLIAALMVAVGLLDRERDMFSERWVERLERVADPLWRLMVLPIRAVIAVHRPLKLALAALKLTALTGLGLDLAATTVDPAQAARIAPIGTATIALLGIQPLLSMAIDSFAPRGIRRLTGREVQLHLTTPWTEQRLRHFMRLGWVPLAISVGALLSHLQGP